jgi:hypothetical protein
VEIDETCDISLANFQLCLSRPQRTLVDAHLKGVPGLGTFTVRSLAGGDLQVLGGQADGALDAELLVLGTVDELLAHLLERLDVARGEGDADLVDLGAFAEVLLGLVYGMVSIAHRCVRAGGVAVL